MFDFTSLQRYHIPFDHWVGEDSISKGTVKAINDEWPDPSFPGWCVEGATWSRKGSVIFPDRLPPTAQALSAFLFSDSSLNQLSSLLGLQVYGDPWFLDAPVAAPKLGGGLREIYQGGILGIQRGSELHPTGFRKVANLLIYLTPDWDEAWGGSLQLAGAKVKYILPEGGRAVLFPITRNSWHGNTEPVLSPKGITRRSLALYLYARSEDMK